MFCLASLYYSKDVIDVYLKSFDCSLMHVRLKKKKKKEGDRCIVGYTSRFQSHNASQLSYFAIWNKPCVKKYLRWEWTPSDMMLKYSWVGNSPIGFVTSYFMIHAVNSLWIYFQIKIYKKNILIKIYKI